MIREVTVRHTVKDYDHAPLDIHASWQGKYKTETINGEFLQALYRQKHDGWVDLIALVLVPDSYDKAKKVVREFPMHEVYFS